MKKINLTLENKPNHYKLYSDCTIYTQFHKYVVFDLNLNQLQEKRKQLIKELKNKNIKVSTKTNDDLFKKYSQDFYFKLGIYKTISEDLEKKFNAIYEKGLYSPTCDNIQLKEAEILYFKLQELNVRSCPLSIFNEIKNHIERIKKDFDNGIDFIWVSV